MKKSKTEQAISSLSYGESLEALDSILEKLQNEDIPLEKVETYYHDAQLYLQRCDELLTKVEQNILKINPEELID